MYSTFACFFFNTEKAESTEMLRENMTIVMRVDRRDLKVFHRGWRMKDGGAALCAEPLGSSCHLPVKISFFSVFLCALAKSLC